MVGTIACAVVSPSCASNTTLEQFVLAYARPRQDLSTRMYRCRCLARDRLQDHALRVSRALSTCTTIGGAAWMQSLEVFYCAYQVVKEAGLLRFWTVTTPLSEVSS